MDTQRRILNPMVVHDAAAYLFWMLVKEVGVSEATHLVVTSHGLCLLQQPFTSQILQLHGTWDSLSPSEQRNFCEAVAAEALEYRSKEAALTGIVYEEDLNVGRSPDALNVSTAHLCILPRNVQKSGKIDKVGILCLRYPLPAVLFSRCMITDEVIEVSDTITALGFHIPMFMLVSTCQQIDSGWCVAQGYFQIPVPTLHQGALWDAVIPNSSRWIQSFQVRGTQANFCIDVEW